jgi:hypothetical protein
MAALMSKKLQAGIARFAVHGALVHVHEQRAAVARVQVDAGVEDAVLVVGVQGAQVGYLAMLNAGEGVVGKRNFFHGLSLKHDLPGRGLVEHLMHSW